MSTSAANSIERAYSLNVCTLFGNLKGTAEIGSPLILTECPFSNNEKNDKVHNVLHLVLELFIGLHRLQFLVTIYVGVQ